ncbi:MAG: hypothetical protein OXE50_15115 [Chloroflexi bacterium]|nr:hypothetical protein [Chloroflexota bacterium]
MNDSIPVLVIAKQRKTVSESKDTERITIYDVHNLLMENNSVYDTSDVNRAVQTVVDDLSYNLRKHFQNGENISTGLQGASMRLWQRYAFAEPLYEHNKHIDVIFEYATTNGWKLTAQAPWSEIDVRIDRSGLSSE